MIANADAEPDAPPADEAAWRRLVEQTLGGRPFETLISRSFEGIEIGPLYPRATNSSPRAFRQKPGPWKIAQRIDHPDPEIANSLARADLDGGADALVLTLAGAPAARGFGAAIATERHLDATLHAIDLDRVPLRLDAGARSLDIARHLRDLVHDRRLGSASLDIDLGHDPIGCLARTGDLPAPPEILGGEAARLSRQLRDSGFSGHLFVADGRPYHEAGAGEAQELASVLATGVAYLRLLERGGLGLEEARAEIVFLLAADADEFLTVAKFRALRQLWASIEAACGLAPAPIRVHAETSYRMMTRYDPWINVLRATIATFSASIGGADTITVLPFTLVLGLPDAAARRLARNTGLVLLHEAGLAKVADPAAGSGAFETLTSTLCERAWALFQRIEAQGGMIASLEAGLPQAEIAATAAQRSTAIARRSFEITGTSAFPDLGEVPIQVLEPRRDLEIEPPSAAAPAYPPLPSTRDSAPFEQLRATVDAFRARTGRRPGIFHLALGADAASAAHAQFARDLFAVAGLEAFVHSVHAAASDTTPFRDSPCRIACVSASASVSPETTGTWIRALRRAGATAVFYAGAEEAIDPDLRRSGIIDVITPGCDVLSVLRHALAEPA